MSLDSVQTVNFAGKDGFFWFFAKVVSAESWKQIGSGLDLSGKQSHRAKIRVCGYDTFNETELPDEDCRWAQFLPSAIVGDGTGGIGETLCLVGGETVLGFFADGPDGQIPMIFSVLPKAQYQVENEQQKNSPVGPKSENAFGLKLDTTKLGLNRYNKEYVKDKMVASTHIVDGKGAESSKILEANSTNKISSIDKCGQDTVSRVRQAIQDYLTFTQSLNQTAGKWIDPVTNELVNMDYQLDLLRGKVQGLMKGTINNIRKKLLKNLNKKFAKLLGEQKTSQEGQNQNISKGSQKAAGGILGLIGCVFKNVLGGIGGLLKNMFSNLLGKIINGALCAIDQFISGIFGKIFDFLEKGLSTIMSGLSWLLGGISSVTGLLRSVGAMGKKILDFLDSCGAPPCEPTKTWTSAIAGGVLPQPPDDWGSQVKNINVLDGLAKKLGDARDLVLGGGADVSDLSVNGVPLQDTIDATNALSDATDTLGLLGLGSIESAISNSSLFGAQNLEFDACNNIVDNPNDQENLTPTRPGFIYPKCIPPIAKVSGPGTGAEFLPIVGNDNRIFSIEVLNGGSGYDQTTSLVVIDNTGNGKGAFARPLVKDGVIEKVVLISTGYGYCVNTTGIGTVGIGTEISGEIEDVFIERPGFRFDPDDTVLIGDEEFPIVTSPDGSIVSVTVPPNVTTNFSTFPKVSFNSATGYGAKMVPVMKFKPKTKIDVGSEQRKTLIGIVSVVDCIGDNKEVVGYVNGVEYSGPYHVMSNGLKMTGATHSETDSIIYDTMEESLGQPVVSSSTYTTTTETTETISETTIETPNIVTEQTTPTIDTTTTDTSTPTMDTTTTTTETSTPPETDSNDSTPPSSGGYGGGY